MSVPVARTALSPFPENHERQVNSTWRSIFRYAREDSKRWPLAPEGALVCRPFRALTHLA